MNHQHHAAGSHNLPARLAGANFPPPSTDPHDFVFVGPPAAGHTWSYGLVVPVNGGGGYLPGAEFWLLNGVDGTATRYINLGTAAACRFVLLTGSGLGARVVTVGAGGQYSSIDAGLTAAAALVPSAASPVVILVLPGTYTEKNTIALSDIALVGLDRDKCVLQFDYHEDGIGAHGVGKSTLDVYNAAGCLRVVISDLTIKNTYADDVGGYGPAFSFNGWSTGIVRNCCIGGNGGRDICSVHDESQVDFVNCTIEQYRAASPASHALWLHEHGSARMYGGSYRVLGAGDGPQFQTNLGVVAGGGEARLDGVRFQFANAANHILASVDDAELLEMRHCTANANNWPPAVQNATVTVVSHNVGFGPTRSATLQVVPGSAPASPVEGEHYYDSGTHKEYVWDGSAWQALW